MNAILKLKFLIMLLLSGTICCCAQIKFSYEGDTLKGNIKKMIEYTTQDEWAYKKIVYTVDLVKRVEKASFFDRNDTLLGKWIVKYDVHQRANEIKLLSYDDTPCESITVTYDTLNRQIERNYSSRSYFPTNCHDLKCRLQGMLDNPVVGIDSSIEVCKYEYYSSGKIYRAEIDRTIFGVEFTRTTTEITDYKYNTSGDTAERITQKIEVSSGVADTSIEKIVYTYAGNGNKLIEIRKMSFPLWPPHTDTVIEITSYKYDNKANMVEESVFNNFPYVTYQNWQSDGKEITTKTIYTYDDRNNVIDKRFYFEQSQYYPARTNNHPGKHIASGTEYAYDSLGNKVSYTDYEMYRNVDGLEIKDELKKRDVNRRDEDWRIEHNEYDKHGNIIKKTRNNITMFTRDIAYYED